MPHRAPRRPATLAALAALALAILGGVAPAGAQRDPGISPQAAQQIAALLASKDSRTPAEQKVDSRLLAAAARLANSAGGPGETIADVAPDGTVTVDITAQVTKALLQRIAGAGGRVISAYPSLRAVRAELPLGQVTAAAAWPEVIFIQPRQEGTTSGPQPTPGLAERAARVREQLLAALPALAEPQPAGAGQGITTDSGKLNTSQGDVAHRTDLARRSYGATGAGVKVCVLSDGVNSLATLEASGDLPEVTVLPGQAGGGNEGAAMLEIVHDIAPGAALLYATASAGTASFAQNILDLRSTYRCDVIIDDYTYFGESPFQLGQAPSVLSTTNAGVIAEAVKTVTADGALYFSSAGNSGNLSDGTSGVWEGDFVAAAGASPPSGAGSVLDFDKGAGVQAYDVVTKNSTVVTLWWSDPLGGSANDYDLFVLNSAGTSVVNSSTNVQSGTQDSVEQIGNVSSGQRLVVVKRAGAADRYLHINTNRGTLQLATDGQVYGHNAAVGVGTYTVAASPAAPGGTATPFTAASLSETFSSDGPRRHFFSSDGTPFTPGNLSSTGGQLAQKPDLTAADGVSCAAPGFSTFLGTSAAAPHAGAIAALLLAARPGLTQAQVRALLTSPPVAIDIEDPGADRTTGAGVLDALALLQASGASAVPLLTFGPVSVAEGLRANGNGAVEPGESVHITTTVTNTTLAAATDVRLSLELISPPDGVSVVTPSVAVGTLAPGATYSLPAASLAISIAPSVSCGTTVRYRIVAAYGGGGGNSPQAYVRSFQIGSQINVSTTLDGVAPPASTRYTATTGSQTARLLRTALTSTCDTPTSVPSVTGTGTRAYDAYTFTNTSASASCVTVRVTQGASAPLFATAYGQAGFNPSSVSANYLADAGTNTADMTFSFSVPAGEQFTVVVHEIDAGGGAGQAYTLNVTGPGVTTCAAPPPQPATIAASGGGGQVTFTGQSFAGQLEATVLDSNGAPVPEAAVTFSGPASGAGVTFPDGAVAATDASGRARVRVVSRGLPGSYSVTASAPGAAPASVSFALSSRAPAWLPLVVAP